MGEEMPKRDYWHVYIVLFRYAKSDPFQAYKAARGGLDIQAHETKASASLELREGRERHGRGNAYIQMCGAIS